MDAYGGRASRYQEQLVHPRNRNEASVAELALRRDETEEESEAGPVVSHGGAWVLVQLQQEAAEGFMQGVVCLGLRFSPTPLWAEGRVGRGRGGPEGAWEDGLEGWPGMLEG